MNADERGFMVQVYFHLRLSAFICGFVLLWSAPLHADAAARPNFIIFIADDVSWEDLGAYGHRSIRTPQIDRLAREGMRFDRAILTTSSCSPSRCSILTGRYPHATGAAELHMPLPAEQVLLTTPLRQAGYYTASSGKWHLGGAVVDQFDHVEQNLKEIGPSGCERWIAALRQRPKDRPFFFWFAAIDAHRPYEEGAFHPPHKPEHVIVPPYLPDEPAVREDLARYYDEVARFDNFIGRVRAELEAQAVLDNTFILVLADNGRPFPRCKTTLYDSGIRTPFIVRMPGRVPAGSVHTSMVSTVDIAPTILELAGLRPISSFQGKSFVPLLSDPTARIRRYAFAEHNWHDYMAYERLARSERFAYIRNWRPDLPATPPADAVRTPAYQLMLKWHDSGNLPEIFADYFQTPRPAEELYDVQADPHFLTNLAQNSAYLHVLEQHRLALDRWQRLTRDTQPQTLTPDRFHRRTGEPLAN